MHKVNMLLVTMFKHLIKYKKNQKGKILDTNEKNPDIDQTIFSSN